jgi:hypothetical protein
LATLGDSWKRSQSASRGTRAPLAGDLWASWTVYWTLVLGLVLSLGGPRDFRGVMGSLAMGAGAGTFVGAVFGGGMWLIIRIRYGLLR